LGLELDLETAQKLVLQGPQAILKHLESQIDTMGLNEEQLAQIEDARRRGVDTLVSSITSTVNKAFEGTASYNDLYNIAKITGIDLVGSIVKTGSGYGLTQRGALQFAGLKASYSGDYAGEARALLD
jgi:hypothetical protein